MNAEMLMDALGELDDALLTQAGAARDRGQSRRRAKGRRRAFCLGAAACLAVLVGAFALTGRNAGRPVLMWQEGFAAEDYFKYSGGAPRDGSGSNSLVGPPPYAEIRDFSTRRESLEAEAVIPAMAGYPLFTCEGDYREDTSLYSLVFQWHRQGDQYSHLTVTAGYEEIPMISDCILIARDENGNVIEPTVTVTERDGVRIVGEKDGSELTLTFQTDAGWYHIKSWNDSAEDVAALLDWFWEHPVDFSRFSMEAGDNYVYDYTEGSFDEAPAGLAAYVPDLSALGYVTEAQRVTRKNGEPVYFEVSYSSADVPSLSWSVDAEPDYYSREDVTCDLSELTFALVEQVRAQEQHITFTWDGYVISVYISDLGSAEDLWQVIEAAGRP